MKNCLLFCLTLLSLKLLVNGKFRKDSTNYTNAVLLDICELVGEKGPCKKNLERYYYSVQMKKCSLFLYGGCAGNSNNFETEKACEKSCPGKTVNTRTPLDCFHEPEKGPCSRLIQSYYYDRKKNDCKNFVYGGCQGNSNRFSTLKKCLSTCQTFEFSLQF